MSANPATAVPFQRLAVAGVDDAGRIIHVQDLATLRDPRPEAGLVEVTIGGETSHVALLEDEALILVSVRLGEQWELAACIVPLLGTIEGGSR